MSVCVQDEGQLLMETRERAFMPTKGKNINKANKMLNERDHLKLT